MANVSDFIRDLVAQRVPCSKCQGLGIAVLVSSSGPESWSTLTCGNCHNTGEVWAEGWEISKHVFRDWCEETAYHYREFTVSKGWPVRIKHETPLVVGVEAWKGEWPELALRRDRETKSLRPVWNWTCDVGMANRLRGHDDFAATPKQYGVYVVQYWEFERAILAYLSAWARRKMLQDLVLKMLEGRRNRIEEDLAKSFWSLPTT